MCAIHSSTMSDPTLPLQMDPCTTARNINFAHICGQKTLYLKLRYAVRKQQKGILPKNSSHLKALSWSAFNVFWGLKSEAWSSKLDPSSSALMSDAFIVSHASVSLFQLAQLFLSGMLASKSDEVHLLMNFLKSQAVLGLSTCLWFDILFKFPDIFLEIFAQLRHFLLFCQDLQDSLRATQRIQQSNLSAGGNLLHIYHKSIMAHSISSCKLFASLLETRNFCVSPKWIHYPSTQLFVYLVSNFSNSAPCSRGVPAWSQT